MKFNKILIAILILAVIFRFYRLFDFQYWSIDEEIFVAVVRQIAAEHKPLLVSPNVAIAVSLGSFFHLLSAPIFWLAGFEANKILIAGSVLGIITTLAIYKTGKELGGAVVGRVASILYAASFLTAFSDRRWWPLSLDPLLSVLAIFSISKIVKGELRYSLPLMISASFAWHADPSLAVIIVFSCLTLIIFKAPIFRKAHLPALLYFLFSILPFFLFELRHPGAVSHPIFELLSRPFSNHAKNTYFDFWGILQGFSRSLFLMPGDTMEKYFAYSKSYPSPLFSPLTEIITVLIFLIPLFGKEKEMMKIIYLYILAFLLGILVFIFGMGSVFHQHYYVVVWPAFFLLAGFAAKQLPKVISYVFLTIFLIVNFYTLFYSSMRYPLVVKEKLTAEAIGRIKDEPFALKVVDDKGYFGGFGGLLFLKNKFPVNSDYYYGWDWIYRAYSLYEVEPRRGPFETTIIISPDGGVNVKRLSKI